MPKNMKELLQLMDLVKLEDTLKKQEIDLDIILSVPTKDLSKMLTEIGITAW